ncbi:MAG: urate hydroxylase PuuD [Pyrinomonadaceae bacterium]
MLIESTVHLPFGLAMLQDGSVFHAPVGDQLARIIVRWFHFAAGITWIGLLYFFNLINVPLQKTLDAPTKKAVNPELLSRTLWWFRWGAVVTVLAGLTYYAMYILSSEAKNAGLNPWVELIVWLAIVLVTYGILYGLYQVPALTKDGRVLGVVIAIVVTLMALVILYLMGNASAAPGKYLGNKSLSIGVGGGIGILMLLNVWGIIWPIQKRAIAATRDGTPAPPPEMMRKAFLASRTNAWLSIPMLFFMGTSHGDYIIFGK